MLETGEYSVSVFTPDSRQAWNRFVMASRNGTFLHNRSYMEYHADRFPDSSLMVWSRDQLIALLPATIHGETLYSHRGLTYGGLVVGRGFHASDAVPVFQNIVCWARKNGLHRMVYKPVPHIYHRMPSEEDLFAIFHLGAHAIRRDVSTAIKLNMRYPYSKGRKSSVKHAERNKLVIRRSSDYELFMAIEADHLAVKHHAVPAHSAEELALLANLFPNNIHLTAAYLQDRMIGGVVTYTTDTVCHAQYIGATPDGKKLGALDACIDQILNALPLNIRWFDFGISMKNNGEELDNLLVMNKESWGGRTVVYDHHLLEF